MILNRSITDNDRAEFLRRLDDLRAGAHGVLLTNWESSFLLGFMRHGTTSWFTSGRRESADKMRMKYGREREINMPMPSDDATLPTKLPEAVANGCQFLVYESGRPHCCNEPATMQRQNGFRYCASHAEQVQRDCKRRGKTIQLVPIKGGKS